MIDQSHQNRQLRPSQLAAKIRVVLILVMLAGFGTIVVYRDSAWRAICHSMARRSLEHRDSESAETWLMRVDLLATADAETTLLRCGVARRTGDSAAYASSLAQAESRGASAFDLQRERILFAAAAGQMRMAEPYLARLLQAEGYDNVDVSRSFINGYLRNQRLHRALPLIEAWMKDAPDDPEPWFIRGRVRHQRSEFVQAESDFSEALRIDPDFPDARLALAAVFLKLGKLREAEQQLRGLGSDDQKETAAQILLAECCLAMQRFDEALRILDSLLQTDPSQFDALFLRAQLDFDQQQFSSALERVDRLLMVRPRMSKARYLRARILQSLNRDGESAAEMERVTQTLAAESELQVLQQRIAETPEDSLFLMKAANLLVQVMEDNS